MGVDVAGGSSTVQQALRVGAIDELTLDIVPVPLGDGERLLENGGSIRLEPIEVAHSPVATHIRYRVG